MGVGIQNTLCGGRNTEILIDFTCFYLQFNRFHMFSLNVSQVRMVCNDDSSKLVPESMQPGFFQVERLFDNLTKNQK